MASKEANDVNISLVKVTIQIEFLLINNIIKDVFARGRRPITGEGYKKRSYEGGCLR